MFHSGDDGKHKYCALALVVMFNNNLKEASLTGKTNNITKTTIEETCEACHLNKGISKLKLKAELDTLEGTYVITSATFPCLKSLIIRSIYICSMSSGKEIEKIFSLSVKLSISCSEFSSLIFFSLCCAIYFAEESLLI
jgi:hypothetical protein